ncbi:thiamine diphosphokinase [Spiroplasma turonicum]|uniref:Thiamine diphosphokinase n=1 Tax=Spiroplasma turonicum TaxID=216946 RepID=A0A0K1P567_9MOLU|nr:thiamine diphosphokinase [Spiroplasma turonicum]AKU79430.1 thiamine pyrophosphokinase [Spiroplasma turonicum]ALX70451.1 thiamine pyrophosphokinase [Spiroplasma turonicum]
MKTKALIVCSETNINISVLKDKYYIVGVERGCLDLIEKNVNIDYAISDFDSVTKKEFEVINSKCKNIFKLKAEKDTLDGVAAIEYVNNNLKVNEILFIVKPSKRVDFNLSIIELVYKYNVKILNDDSVVFKIDSGITNLEYKKFDSFNYLSLFALKDSIITLKNMKYSVKDYNLAAFSSNAFSNELKNEQDAEIISNNELMVMFTK